MFRKINPRIFLDRKNSPLSVNDIFCQGNLANWKLKIKINQLDVKWHFQMSLNLAEKVSPKFYRREWWFVLFESRELRANNNSTDPSLSRTANTQKPRLDKMILAHYSTLFIIANARNISLIMFLWFSAELKRVCSTLIIIMNNPIIVKFSWLSGEHNNVWLHFNSISAK